MWLIPVHKDCLISWAMCKMKRQERGRKALKGSSTNKLTAEYISILNWCGAEAFVARVRFFLIWDKRTPGEKEESIRSQVLTDKRTLPHYFWTCTPYAFHLPPCRRAFSTRLCIPKRNLKLKSFSCFSWVITCGVTQAGRCILCVFWENTNRKKNNCKLSKESCEHIYIYRCTALGNHWV